MHPDLHAGRATWVIYTAGTKMSAYSGLAKQLLRRISVFKLLLLLASVLSLVSLAACEQGGGAREGGKAPAFTLADARGEPAALEQLLNGKEALVLVFYRGFG